MDDDAKAALQKLADAVRISDGDSLGALNPDRMVIWNATSSWQGSVSITLGDLRALTKQLRYEHCVQDRVQAFAAFYPDERLLEHYRSLVAQQLPESDADIDAALLEFKRRGITV